MNNRKICGVPFSEIRFYQNSFDDNKLIYMNCCPSWLNTPYNEYSENVSETPSGYIDIMEVWNTKRNVELRKSVFEGSYKYCKLSRCPNYISDRLPPVPDRAMELAASGIFEMDYPPLIVHVGVDKACNLCCPTCRTSPIPISNEKSYNRLKSVLESGVEGIVINGSGELFKNRYLLDCLSDANYPKLKNTSIITNGTLLNEIMWASLPVSFQNSILNITVSVDAASSKTYSRVRPGGNFDRLLKNLRFIGRLKNEGKIRSFGMAFVLQQDNKHELLDFVKLAHEVGAGTVVLTGVDDWSLYPHKEFLNRFKVPDGEMDDIFIELRMYIRQVGLDYYTNLW